MRETAPRIVRDGGSEFWVYEDRQIVTTGLNAVAGKTKEEFSPEPITYEDMREGCYEPAARVADLNEGHVLSSMLFPSFPRYCGQVFHETKDKEVALACVRAWNDFLLEEFAGAYTGRFIPLMIIPLWDPVLAAGEVERTAALGGKSIAFSENPTKLHGVLAAANQAGTLLDWLFSGNFVKFPGLKIALPQDTQDKLTVGNAARIYNFTPADPATIPA
jgi:hypothetical protein